MFHQTITYNSNRCYHKKQINSKRKKKSDILNSAISNSNYYSNNPIYNHILSNSNSNNITNSLNSETTGYISCTYNYISDTFTFRNPETVDNINNKEDEIVIKPKKTTLKKLDKHKTTLHYSIKNKNFPKYYRPKKAKALVYKVPTYRSKNALKYENYISSIVIIQKYVKAFLKKKLLYKNKIKDNNCFNTIRYETMRYKNDSKDKIIKRCSLKEKKNIIYNKLNAISNKRSIIIKKKKKDSKVFGNLDDSEYCQVKEETVPIGINTSLSKFNFSLENSKKFEKCENTKQNAKELEKDECDKSIDEKSSFYEDNEFVVISYDYNKNNKTKKENFILKGFDLIKTNKYIIFYERLRIFILNRVFRIFLKTFKEIISIGIYNDNDDKTICDNCSTISSGRVLVNGDIYDKARTDLMVSNNNNICNNSLITNQYKKSDPSDINTVNSFIVNTGN